MSTRRKYRREGGRKGKGKERKKGRRKGKGRGNKMKEKKERKEKEILRYKSNKTCKGSICRIL